MSMNQRIIEQIEFIKEIDKLKNILRMTLVGDSSRRENDAEHSWHLAMMALILHEYSEKSIDLNRVIKMLLVHDLIEIYAGDTFAYDPKALIDKEKREKEAADKLFSQLPADQEKEFYELWTEFEKMESSDSLFANAMDRLQPFISNVMTNGHTWEIGNVTKVQILTRMAPIKDATPKLWPYILDTVSSLEKEGLIKN